MIAQTKVRYARGSPKKVKLIIDLIRGKDVNTSLAILTHVNKGKTELISKALKSAISNAKQKGLSEDQLYISKIIANPGPHWKRFRAASFGRANPILKRTMHLSIELDLITNVLPKFKNN